MALVVCTLIKTELAKIAPTGMDNIAAYTALIGFIAARSPEAIESGMPTIPTTRPAVISDTIVRGLIYWRLRIIFHLVD